MPNTRVSLKDTGADLFFGDYAPSASPPSHTETEEQPPSLAGMDTAGRTPLSPMPTRPGFAHRDPTDRVHGPHEPSLLSGTAAGEEPANQMDTVEVIRKTVKAPGREVAFTRMTAEEKTELADIVDAERRQGHKTTENEITRIAIANLVRDYHAHGEQPLKQRTFGTRLTERGCGKAKSGSTRYRTGIRLIDPDEPTQAGFVRVDTSQSAPPRDVPSHDMSHQKPHDHGESDALGDTRDGTGHDFPYEQGSEKCSRDHTR